MMKCYQPELDEKASSKPSEYPVWRDPVWRDPVFARL